MSKIFLFGLLIFGIAMCNRTGANQTATFVKVCRYNCDSALICNTYFFEKMDSFALDSFENVGITGKSYIGSNSNDYELLPFAKKDTVIFILND
jgi:hypothetical protein